MILHKASSTRSTFPGSISTAIEQLIHGTTVVINAITQRSGVKTALLTTEGFRDALHIGRGNRPDMYNLRFHKPEPLVPRRLRFEVARAHAGGRYRSSVHSTQRSAHRARGDGCATKRSKQWRSAFCIPMPGRIMSDRRSDMLTRSCFPGVSITCSSDVCREWREYERTVHRGAQCLCSTDPRNDISRISTQPSMSSTSPSVAS